MAKVAAAGYALLIHDQTHIFYFYVLVKTLVKNIMQQRGLDHIFSFNLRFL